MEIRRRRYRRLRAFFNSELLHEFGAVVVGGCGLFRDDRAVFRAEVAKEFADFVGQCGAVWLEMSCAKASAS